ncbi:MAG: cell envelope integrity protein CreD [Flavipsychrobacter sp.]|nr:cell envelope integrity protein CreD [Flavipsychrobacter sp.]
METNTENIPGFYERNKTLLKGFLIGFLILLMLIPAAIVSNLVSERQERQAEVVKEVSSKWAGEQTIIGPIVIVPYKVYVQQGSATIAKTMYLNLLPESLLINGNAIPEVRRRSLYTVMLYRSDIELSGSFNPSEVQRWNIAPQDIMWEQSKLVLGLNDARGLEEEVVLNWGNTKKTMEAGVINSGVISSGLNTSVAFDSAGKASFNVRIKLKGSSRLYFTPVGKTTEVNLKSAWKSPAFDGQYLPDKPAVISADGFNAHWKILQVSRNYPQCWPSGNTYEVEKSAFGVKLIQPADGYAKTDRSVKYAILFIALTFTVFFFIEILQKKQVHPLQYILVGLALCIFYTLLLSISEYTGFNPAYFIAAVATVSLIGSYVWGIFKTFKIAAGFIFALGGLYTYIFILIQLEDYALLFGSIGLFVILAIIMYYSRKIDWYNTSKKQ